MICLFDKGQANISVGKVYEMKKTYLCIYLQLYRMYIYICMYMHLFPCLYLKLSSNTIVEALNKCGVSFEMVKLNIQWATFGTLN